MLERMDSFIYLIRDYRLTPYITWNEDIYLNDAVITI